MTSSDNLTILTRNDFMSYKPLPDPPGLKICDWISDKYEHIFETYACFHDTSFVVAPPPHILQAKQVADAKTHHHGRGRGGRGGGGGSSKKSSSNQAPFNIPLPPPRRPKDPAKAIMGLLNVINTDNFGRVFMKMRLYLDRDNIEHVVMSILEKCCIATIYVNVYIKLLEDLAVLFNIRDVIIKFVQNAHKAIEFVEKEGEDQYDQFCRIQKQKLYVQGQNVTIIKLTKAGFIGLDMLKRYASYFIKEVTQETREYYLDIYLNALLELQRSYRHLIVNPNELCKQIHTESPRLKFLVQSLGSKPY